MRVSLAQTQATLAILLVSASLGMLVDWRAPGIERYARDWLMRARGVLPAPEDIAIVAIDEASINRFGRFPWPRSLMARAIDTLSAAQPKVIAIDVLYTDRSAPAEDAALAQSIERAGNVVVAAQLVEAPDPGGPNAWLLPLPDIQRAASAVGHVNVSTESEGIAREFLVTAADDAGHAVRAMPLEAIRIGDRTPETGLLERPRTLLLGARVIPVDTQPVPPLTGKMRVLRPMRIAIDYIGPAGSFAARTYSFADLVEGRVPGHRFRNKYVLIGATAASLGDRLASPFVHHIDARSDEHGTLMPGVEVLANALNTVLRSRFYSETPDWIRFIVCLAVALVTVLLLRVAEGRYEALKQVAVLAGIAVAIPLFGYLAFDRSLVFLPIAPALVSFSSAGVLCLLRRSLVTSSRLDAGIADVVRAGEFLAPAGSPADAVRSIARMTRASAVAIFEKSSRDQYRLVARHGLAISSGAPLNGSVFHFGTIEEQKHDVLKLTFPQGLVAIAYERGSLLPSETPMICTAIAASACQTAWDQEDPSGRPLWPRGLEWKARSLGKLNGLILERAKFVDSALRSVEDGLVIAAADGRITFANRRAGAILGAPESALIGRDLFQRLRESAGVPDAAEDREFLARLIVDRATVEREIAIRNTRLTYYNLRIATVAASPDTPVLGVVATLSDITRQRELQQLKNDVVALVTHEMRTPLTAIQGMSELLSEFQVDPARQREMNRAINDEAKRLNRMITEYLDIARLESGATAPRPTSIRIEALAERALLLLDPVAEQRHILLHRRFAANLPALFADGDLISRAIRNLVSNAIKYSPEHTDIEIVVTNDEQSVFIRVIDHGFGIPEADLERVFEKFYRVPRVQDADTPGTGLGLALVREVADLHGGSVSVSSRVNQGSTFVLRIPRAKDPSHG